jgi:hypothetical protein
MHNTQVVSYTALVVHAISRERGVRGGTGGSGGTATAVGLFQLAAVFLSLGFKLSQWASASASSGSHGGSTSRAVLSRSRHVWWRSFVWRTIVWFNGGVLLIRYLYQFPGVQCEMFRRWPCTDVSLAGLCELGGGNQLSSGGDFGNASVSTSDDHDGPSSNSNRSSYSFSGVPSTTHPYCIALDEFGLEFYPTTVVLGFDVSSRFVHFLPLMVVFLLGVLQQKSIRYNALYYDDVFMRCAFSTWTCRSGYDTMVGMTSSASTPTIVCKMSLSLSLFSFRRVQLTSVPG